MNDRTDQAKAQFAVVAMRDAAEKLRADATALLNEAEITARRHVEAARQRAEEMRAAAAEIDADADAKQQQRQAEREAASRPQTPAPVPAVGTVAPCPGEGCPVPVAWDGLGWTHAGATDCGADLSGYVPQPAALTTQQDGGPQE